MALGALSQLALVAGRPVHTASLERQLRVVRPSLVAKARRNIPNFNLWEDTLTPRFQMCCSALSGVGGKGATPTV